MRTRKSWRNQQRLYRSIGRELALADSGKSDGYEADPSRYVCPDGPCCTDPECIRLNASRKEDR